MIGFHGYYCYCGGDSSNYYGATNVASGNPNLLMTANYNYKYLRDDEEQINGGFGADGENNDGEAGNDDELHEYKILKALAWNKLRMVR